jgi:hypothetical protein
VPRPTQVADEAVQEPALLADEGSCLRVSSEGEDRRRQVVPERQVHAPAVEPLLRLLAGVPHRRVDVDPGHERAGRVAGRDARVRLVEGQEHGREGARPAGLDGGFDERFGLRQGGIRCGADFVRRGGEVHR